MILLHTLLFPINIKELFVHIVTLIIQQLKWQVLIIRDVAIYSAYREALLSKRYQLTLSYSPDVPHQTVSPAQKNQ